MTNPLFSSMWQPTWWWSHCMIEATMWWPFLHPLGTNLSTWWIWQLQFSSRWYPRFENLVIVVFYLLGSIWTQIFVTIGCSSSSSSSSSWVFMILSFCLNDGFQLCKMGKAIVVTHPLVSLSFFWTQVTFYTLITYLATTLGAIALAAHQVN